MVAGLLALKGVFAMLGFSLIPFAIGLEIDNTIFRNIISIRNNVTSYYRQLGIGGEE